MKKQFYVISCLGRDRVGIVDELAGAITAKGGNIEESKMAVLGSDFAIIMLISAELGIFDDPGVKDLETKLDLSIAIKATTPPHILESGRPYILETVSLDRRGIVHSIGKVLHRFSINIEDMETKTEKAALTGAPLFCMKANIIIGPSVSVATLRTELEQLQTTQDLDIILSPLVPARRD